MTTLGLFDKPASKINLTTATFAAARCLLPSLTRNRPIDRHTARNAMNLCFGGTDNDGVWSWRQAFEAIEVAQLLNLRRNSALIERLEDQPNMVVDLLKTLTGLGLTHTRRSEDQIEWDQFSTPLELGALIALAGQIRPDDLVLEPSAGNGALAVVAEILGAKVSVNELEEVRFANLKTLFANSNVTRHDALDLSNILPLSGQFDAVLMNPPFTGLAEQIEAGMKALADNGRLVAIVPTSFFTSKAIFSLSQRYRVHAMIGLPDNSFYKHGTSVETGILVIDRVADPAPLPEVQLTENLDQVIVLVSKLPARLNARKRRFLTVQVQPVRPAALTSSRPSSRLSLLASVAELTYNIKSWSGTTTDVGLYSTYEVARLAFPEPRPHPAQLVEASAMATTPPPVPSYIPQFPVSVLKSQISDIQLEAVIYAGEAHSKILPSWWSLDDTKQIATASKAEVEGAFQCRQGFFIGDGTGVGKGTEAAGIIADNMGQGRTKALWLSKNGPLIEDAIRDWVSLGGSAADFIDLSKYKQGATITADKGILFCTYATLRTTGRGDKKSRLEQIVEWCGEDFDGAIIFDEAHEMGNAAGGKGNRGVKKASQQGKAGLLLQYRLNMARVTYVSATGATVPSNLSYAPRLGLWGCSQTPFLTREEFLSSAEGAGVAMMELIARELKAQGLYIARMLSMEGVTIDPLLHELTDSDVEIWNAWADAFHIIYKNLTAALEATRITDEEGTNSSRHKAAARSAFAGAQQRFFNALLCGLKAPSVIRAMEDDLANEKSCVVQLISTNEAVTERRLDEVDPADFNDMNLDLTPRDAVTNYLMNAFPVHLMKPVEDENGNSTCIPVLDEEGRAVFCQEALEMREQLLLDLQLLPAVPGILDSVIHHFGQDKVAEVTGRGRRVVMKNGRQVVDRRSANANKAETDAFNNGDKRILVFSQAGGTGRSYHADRNYANQQQRISYLVEYGWRADVAIQGLGRVNRSNQASKPVFRPVSANIRGELRFLSTIAKRLDTLGALSKGERRSAGNGMFSASDNLENEYARRALRMFFEAMYRGDIKCMPLEDFEDKTALSLRNSDGVLKEAEDLPELHTFLNRLLSLRISDQNDLFDEFRVRIEALVRRAEKDGTLDKGVEDIVPQELVVLGEQVIRTDVSGAETRLCSFETKSPRRLHTLEMVEDIASGYHPERVQYAFNTKSQKVALVTTKHTDINDDGFRVEAVRIYRPNGDTHFVALTLFEESNWHPISKERWLTQWQAEIASFDAFVTEKLYLVTGLLMKVWKLLPEGYSPVKRLKCPTGKRWLGRTIDEAGAYKLLTALGLMTASDLTNDVGRVAELIRKNSMVRLSQQLIIKRSRVMDKIRIEVTGNRFEFQRIRQMGGFIETIAGNARLFLPVDDRGPLEAVIKAYGVTEVLV